jgi:hypothetical protein
MRLSTLGPDGEGVGNGDGLNEHLFEREIARPCSIRDHHRDRRCSLLDLGARRARHRERQRRAGRPTDRDDHRSLAREGEGGRRIVGLLQRSVLTRDARGRGRDGDSRSRGHGGGRRRGGCARVLGDHAGSSARARARARAGGRGRRWHRRRARGEWCRRGGGWRQCRRLGLVPSCSGRVCHGVPARCRPAIRRRGGSHERKQRERNGQNRPPMGANPRGTNGPGSDLRRVPHELTLRAWRPGENSDFMRRCVCGPDPGGRTARDGHGR